MSCDGPHSKAQGIISAAHVTACADQCRFAVSGRSEGEVNMQWQHCRRARTEGALASRSVVDATMMAVEAKSVFLDI